MPKQTINYALAATLLTTNATLAEIAPQVGAKSANSLRVGLAKRGVTAKQARSLDFHPDRIHSAAIRVASQASEALRSQFSSELANAAKNLSAIPLSKSLKHLKQRAEVLEPLARTAKIVHDWGSEQSNALVFSGQYSPVPPQEHLQPTTDIQAIAYPEHNQAPAIAENTQPDNDQDVTASTKEV